LSLDAGPVVSVLPVGEVVVRPAVPVHHKHGDW
jgi:hypothetical protein